MAHHVALSARVNSRADPLGPWLPSDTMAGGHQVDATKERVWTAPVLQGLRETAGIIGSGCLRVSGLERDLIAAGLDG